MGNPDKFAALDAFQLLGRYLVRACPAAKVGRPCDPRIGNQHRHFVVADECGIADGFKPNIHGSSKPRGPRSTPLLAIVRLRQANPSDFRYIAPAQKCLITFSPWSRVGPDDHASLSR